MALPKIVEYLLSLENEDGSRLVTHGVQQTFFTSTPYEQITISQMPFAQEFMNIVYEFTFDPSMVPESFYAWSMIQGSRSYEGIMTEWWMVNTIPVWIVVTQFNPVTALLQNLTPLNQYYIARSAYLAVAGENEYDQVLVELRRAQKDTALAEQATSLLAEMKMQGDTLIQYAKEGRL